MSTLLEKLQAVDPRAEVFRVGEEAIDALALRAAVAQAARDLAATSGSLVLVCRSAALQLVGLLAAAVLGRRLLLPAHDAPAYLAELGIADGVLLTDTDPVRPRHYKLALPAGDTALPAPLGGGDPELVFFTSGTTGAPKAIAKSLSCLEAEALVLASLWPLQPGHVVEGTVSHQHIYGLLYRIVLPVLAGHVGQCLPRDYWEQLVGRLDEGTLLVTSPAHLKRLPDGLPWERMRPALVFCSTAPLPFAAAEAASVRLGQLPTEIYGSTETGGIAWRRQVRSEAAWTTLPGIELSSDAAGDAVLRSPFIGPGQPFRLADRIEWLDDGRFHLRGRLDRVVKVEGKRVSLPRVEQALLALDAVSDAAVVDLPTHDGALGAVVVPTTEARAELERDGAFRYSRRLRAALAVTFEPAERPKLWRFLQALPHGRHGKHDLATMRRLFTAPGHVLPRHRLISVGDYAAQIAIELDQDLVWFAGHFPDQPILSGLAQIHLSKLFAESLWRLPPLASHLTRVKFRRLVREGDQINLHLGRDPDRAMIRFRYECGPGPVSEGILGEA